MAATTAQRVTIAAYTRHGLTTVEELRHVLAEIESAETPMDLRRLLTRLRGPGWPLAEKLLDVMPRSGTEVYADFYLWYHAADGRRGRDWMASPMASPGDVLELQQSPGDLLVDDDTRRRFEREHATLQNLTHPHIEPCLGYGIVVEDAPYRLTPLREGGTLRRFLDRRGRLGVAEILVVAVQAARGLDAAHDAGLVHRDLDAYGIGLTTSGGLQILDLGRAGDRALVVPPRVSPLTPRAGQDWTAGKKAADEGTRHWRKVDRTRLELWRLPANPPAPEAKYGVVPDARSDVFQLGVLLVQALTGQIRTENGWPSGDPLARYPDLEHGLARLLAACLEEDPTKRPSATEVVAYGEALMEAQGLPRTQGLVVGGTTKL